MLISWMATPIVRWELVITLRLMLHQVNPELEEAASATVVVAAVRSRMQSSDCRIWKQEKHHIVFFQSQRRTCLLLFPTKNKIHLMFFFICSISNYRYVTILNLFHTSQCCISVHAIRSKILFFSLYNLCHSCANRKNGSSIPWFSFCKKLTGVDKQ